ncbi:hypothetical protein [Arthrobacter sp. AB6]|uniref:hypothetical protein n=1 Tax=Arthrobacter sp. AB6 TaxID=2962570 RepID=UPI0037BE7A00
MAELIRRHRESTGEGYTLIAQRAGLSEATVRRMAAATPPRASKPEILDNLATALGLSPMIVRLAALASADSSEGHRGGRTGEVLGAALKGLPPQDLAAAAVVMESLRNQRS